MGKQQQLQYNHRETTGAAGRGQYCKAERLDHSSHLNVKCRLKHLLPAQGPEATFHQPLESLTPMAGRLPSLLLTTLTSKHTISPFGRMKLPQDHTEIHYIFIVFVLGS